MRANLTILNALLALLLVLSQQLGMAHAVSHWSDYRHASEQLEDSDKGLSPGLALDHNCSQCAAFAQLASAIHTPNYSFPSVEFSAPRGDLAPALAQHQRTSCAYHSRAPPLA